MHSQRTSSLFFSGGMNLVRYSIYSVHDLDVIFLCQCPLSEDLICCDVFEQIQHSFPAGELLWFHLRLNVANGLLFKLMQSPRYSLKSDKTRTGGYLVGSKLLKDFGKGILLTHNARQPASRRL